MDPEFPSNSKQSRAAPEPRAKKQIQQIVTGPVIQRKKPLGKRMAESIFGGMDARTAWNYVLFDVLIPGAKDTFVDAITSGAERAVFGESSARRGRRSSSSTGHINYQRMSQGRPDPRDRDRDISRRARATHDFGEIILDTRIEAEGIIDQLFELVSTYEMATVSDLYAMVGIRGAHTDENWGWTDLRGAGVQRLSRGGGYLLDLPRPEPLK